VSADFLEDAANMRPLIFSDQQTADRCARVIAAFAENGVGSTATLVSVLSALYRAVPDALGHAQRVASVATRIGTQLAFTDRELDHLERAAWLHDLGKFIIPDVDDELQGDDEETERLYTARWARQVDLAVEVIETVPVLVPAAALVRASRECIDGSGYPRGLRGGEIPLGARVLHVADTFDALSSVCASLGVDQGAVPVELVRNSGSRFDPAVVAACLRALDMPPAAAQGY
jgi:response regulator RpfG family c-di-GMP phosphodiesterase